MQNKTLVNSGLKVLALAVSLAGMSSLAQGGVILLVNGGTVTDGSAEVVGQSFLTPGGGPWGNITFNFFSDVDPASTPLAAGDAFLLTQEFLGPVSGLSSATPGFLAESTGISGGKYIFDSGLVLNPNTEYWLYEDSPIQTTGASTGETPALQGYFINEGDFCTCSTSLSNFELDGSSVPEPGTWLTGLTGFGILGLLRLRNSWSRNKSQS